MFANKTTESKFHVYSTLTVKKIFYFKWFKPNSSKEYIKLKYNKLRLYFCIKLNYKLFVNKTF